MHSRMTTGMPARRSMPVMMVMPGISVMAMGVVAISTRGGMPDGADARRYGLQIMFVGHRAE